MDLKQFKDTFTARIGINMESLFAEFDRLASRLGIRLDDPLTDAFVRQAKGIYAAYIAGVSANVTEVGFAELLALMKTGQVPRRKKRVGASTA